MHHLMNDILLNIKYKTKEEQLVLFRHYDKVKRVLSGKITELNVIEFIKLNSNPIVMKLTINNLIALLKGKKPVLLISR